MDNLTYIAMEFCEHVDRCMDLPSLSNEFTRVIRHFGFTRFSVDRFLQNHQDNPISASVMHTWPRSWVDRYISEQYFKYDRVAEFASTQVRPWTWDEVRSRIPANRVLTQMSAEAAELGMVDGIVVALHDSRSLQAIVSLGSERKVSMPAWHRKLLHMVCLHAQQRATEIRDQNRRVIPQLSEREREALKWMASGKNLVQTAEVLKVSTHTARTYVDRARSKMDAANVTQTVVAAIRSKQIKL